MNWKPNRRAHGRQRINDAALSAHKARWEEIKRAIEQEHEMAHSSPRTDPLVYLLIFAIVSLFIVGAVCILL